MVEEVWRRSALIKYFEADFILCMTSFVVGKIEQSDLNPFSAGGDHRSNGLEL